MKKVNWVVDKYLFDEYEDRLATAIKNSGSNVYFYDDLCGKTFKEYITGKFTDKDIVVFHGSLQHGMQLSHLPIYPGTFMTIQNYECYKYYGYYGNLLLNEDYMMMGLNDVLRNKEKIFTYFDRYSQKKKVFIRPSDGFKSFAGQLLSYDNFDEEFNVLIQSYGGIDMESVVLISGLQNILEEYRFVIVDGKVISGTTYFDSENVGTFNPHYDKICIDEDAIKFANSVVKLYQPDKAFTIDVCKTDIEGDEYKLLEIGSFNCASMYGNDYDAIVKSINDLSIKEYDDLFNI